MEIIEQIGSYAGLAAVVGLAVLSALYFSQARDLRRLRESEESGGAGAEQVAGAGGPKRPTAAVVPGQNAAARGAPQAAQPAGATAGAQGGQAPAQSGQAAPAPGGQPGGVAPTRAAPVGAQGNGDQETDERAASGAAPRSAPAAAGPAAAGPAAAPPAGGTAGGGAGSAQAPAQETEVQDPPGRGGGTPPQPPPQPPRLPTPRPGAASAALRAASAPSAAGTGRRWYSGLPPRYIALIVAGVVVVSAGAVYAVTSLVGEGTGDTTAEVAGDGGAADGGPAPLDPSTITVAVLNGTDVAGLAAQVADTVEQAGFQRGNVANATEQASAESAVLYADGARRAARQVGQELGISQIEPIDEQSQALAGTADVVVIVGADRAE